MIWAIEINHNANAKKGKELLELAVLKLRSDLIGFLNHGPIEPEIAKMFGESKGLTLMLVPSNQVKGLIKEAAGD